jgi:AcrR family transcriptional regulator
MSPRTEKQFEEIRENKRAIIIETALILFAEKGYYATSIQEITKKAGISKGLLYNYFESKEALLKEIVINGFNELIFFFDKNKDGILTDEEFDYFIRESFVMISKNMSFWKLYFSLLVQPPVMDLISHQMMEYFDPLFHSFSGFFEGKGFEDPLAEVRFIAALLDGVGMHYLLDPENYPLEHSVNKIISIYTNK